MGREAAAEVRFGDQSGPAKLLLEADALILRGAVRARIPRDAIRSYAVNGDDLTIATDLGTLRATLGAPEAAAWLRALAKPRPTLAQKLGVSPTHPARVLGQITDATLAAALLGATTEADAAILIAELTSPDAMDRALTEAQLHPGAALWGVTEKGKAAGLSDADLRRHMRAAGYIDTKSCAVSDRFTATRYVFRAP